MRFRDFLRVAVLLFAATATVLAAVAIAGATRADDNVLLYVSLGWWAIAGLIGLWLGRRPAATAGIARLLATARSTSTLPTLEPATVLFNRLWSLAATALVAGGVGVVVPQVPAIATGYGLLVALMWRRQYAAVAAIEARDGVEFWFDRSSPFRAPKLLRLPGLRRVEPTPMEEEPAPI
jgi:hypothetical protein